VITADAEFPAAALSDSDTLCLCSPKPWATRTLTGLSISAGRQFTFRRDFDVAHTHVTASTQFVEANGLRFAYRRFGQESGIPLLFLQHFRGGMNHWDPAVTDGFAESRPVILFDNAGVASSSGETPNTIEAMADDAVAFVRKLKLSQVDLLGFSIGGYVSQAQKCEREKCQFWTPCVQDCVRICERHGINKSTLWYHKHNLAAGRRVKIYKEVISKLA
jgi:alpha/beta hydrolase fold